MRNLKKDTIDKLFHMADLSILRIRLGLSTKKRAYNIASKKGKSYAVKLYETNIENRKDLKKAVRLLEKARLLNTYCLKYALSFYEPKSIKAFKEAKKNKEPMAELLLKEKGGREFGRGFNLFVENNKSKLLDSMLQLEHKIEEFTNNQEKTIINPLFETVEINTLTKQPTVSRQMQITTYGSGVKKPQRKKSIEKTPSIQV